MTWVKKSFAYLFGIVLFGSLLGVVGLININQSLGKPETVKELAAESGVYEKFVTAALETSTQEAKTANANLSIPLDNIVVIQAAKQALPPSFIEEKANIIIDANYAWLQGKTPAPSFRVDISDAKQNFAQRVGQYITERLKGLPACTDQQLAQIAGTGTAVDPLTITCRPATVNAETEGARVTSELQKSTFLQQPVITADTLGREANSQTPTYYADLSQLPRAYQLMQWAPVVLGIVAAISALAVLFLAPYRRRGWRRIGIIFVLAGLILIGTKLVATTAANQLSDRVATNVAAELAQPRTEFIHHVADTLVKVNLIVGGVLTLLGLAILIYLYLIGRQKKVARPDDFHDAAAPGSTIAPRLSEPPVATKQPLAPRPDLKPQTKPPTPGYNHPPTPAPKKRPPRRRGPGLIQ